MRRTKKRVSLLLCFIMIVSMCNINPMIVFAASDTKVQLNYLPKVGLRELDGKIKENTIPTDAEEATLSWSIEGGTGLYELEYFTDSISSSSGTTMVKLGFNVGQNKDGGNDPKKVHVTAELYDESGSKINNVTSYKYKSPYTGDYENLTTGETYHAEMTIPIAQESIPEPSKELSLQIGSNLRIRTVTDGKTIKVCTDQINKGYITDFSLYYTKAGTKKLQTTQVVFPGIRNAKISSIYLDGTIEGKKIPIDTTITDPTLKQEAGDRPGIKVEVERPKIRKGKTFEYIDSTQADKIKTALYLWTKLEPDSTAKENNIQLNFDLGGINKIVDNDYGNRNKRPQYNNETHCVSVILAKEDSEKYINPTDKDKVVVWPALEESMVIGADFRISGEAEIDRVNDAGQKIKHSIDTGNVALDTGFTYLRFVPEQSNVGEVTLKITPFKYKGEITYKVYVANATTTPGDINYRPITGENTLLGEYKYMYDPNYPDRKLEISVPSGVRSIFLVKATLKQDNGEAVSQEVYYNIQGAGIVVRPYTPSINDVNKIYVIPEGENSVEAAGMNLIWSAPTEAKLLETLKEDGPDKKRALYFELALYDAKKENKAVVAIFKATLKDDKQTIDIKQVGHQYTSVIYNKEKNQFKATNIVLKDMDKLGWEKINLPSGYETGITYPTINDASYASGVSYTIPSSFYLSMRAVLETTYGLKASANESQVYPITLDKTNEVIPTPTDILVDKKLDSTDVVVKFKDVKIDDFVNYTLKPAKWKLKEVTTDSDLAGQYEIALYQDKYIEANETKKNEISDSELTKYVDTYDTNKIYKWASLLTTPASISIDTDATAQKALREGKAVIFTLKSDNIGANLNNLEIKGLDPNCSYYVRIRVKLDSERAKAPKERTDYSLFSKNIGFTTITVVKPIDPDEEVPPTPKDYTAEAKDNSTAVLNWRDPEISTENPSALSYEIIRVTTDKINEELLKRNMKASEIVSRESAKQATLFGSDKYQRISGENGAYYELKDDTLQPNTVYYYYIRTVYNGVYSDWIYQPVTTKNIDAPISLSAFNATKTTVDVGFLAKVPSTALFGTFDFGIAIQSEDDGKWQTILASSLSAIAGNKPTSIEEGYNYYAYRITGLKPGKRYNIKVCVIDKTKEKIDDKYQQSLYSNIVYIRTEYDQGEQDKENKYKEYIERFENEVEKFKNTEYWTLEEDGTYKYRVDYIAADMGLNKEYVLATEGSKNEGTYYLPINVITMMNEEKTTLKVELEDDVVYIRPDTIREDNELVQEAQDLISSSQLKDYYFKLSVTKSRFNGNINNEEVISPKINVDMSIIYMKQEDHLTEAEILEALDSIVNDKKKVFIDKIDKKISSGKLADDELKSILDDVLSDVKEKHAKQVSRIMDKQTKREITLDKINKAILIMHKGDHAAVNAYYYKKDWIAVEVLPVGDGFAVEAMQLGSYIFTGQKPLIDTVPEVAQYQDFINQYQLTEFFKMDSYMLDVAVNKEQVYGSLARILGASKGTDYITYLQSKGIKGISKLTSGKFIRQDEAIYIIMQGYEVCKHRKVETIAIKNRQGVQNIGAFQPVYRPYVYAAVELKVIKAQDSKVVPSKQLTAKDIISMLYMMQS